MLLLPDDYAIITVFLLKVTPNDHTRCNTLISILKLITVAIVLTDFKKQLSKLSYITS